MFDRLKSEAVKVKDQLQADINPLKKIDECITILNEEYKKGDDLIKATGATAVASGAATVVSKSSTSSFAKGLGFFAGLVTVVAGAVSGGLAIERETRPLSSLDRDKVRKLLNISEELRLGLTEQSMLREALVVFQNARTRAIRYER